MGEGEFQLDWDVKSDFTTPFMQKLVRDSGILVRQEGLVRQAFDKRREAGLFQIFLHRSFFECIQQWTNKFPVRKRKYSIEDVKAYIGLEMASSIVRMNDLKDYWSTEIFLGNHDFQRVMSRGKFLQIRSELRLYPFYDSELAHKDPLWHSNFMFKHFSQNAANVAITIGVTSLDENTIRSCGQCGAITYMKNKPVKFGIRFSVVTDWKFAYVHSISDNGSGNTTGIPTFSSLLYFVSINAKLAREEYRSFCH